MKVKCVVILLIIVILGSLGYSADFQLKSTSKSRSRNAAIVVNSTIYDSLETQINQWKADKESLGWSISKHIMPPISPEALRDSFIHIYGQDSINSAMLVGHFTFPKYQAIEVATNTYQEFPFTTFWENVNGTWKDSLIHANIGGRETLVPGRDSIYDTHAGNRSIEFSLGVLDASGLTFGNDSFGNEIQRLRSYFQRNHNGSTNDTALLYVDDNFVWCVSPCSTEIITAYPYLKVVSDSNATTPQDYRQRLQRGYELIQLGCHGDQTSYAFQWNNGTQFGYVNSYEIPEINPQSLFYIINSCYTCDLDYNDAIGKQILFSSNKSLAELGYCARCGPPAAFFDTGFWPSLIIDSSFGNAYKIHKNFWMNLWPPGTYHNPDAYALVYLGDPTLKIHPCQNQPYIEELVNNAVRVNNLYEIRPSIITNGKLLVKAFTSGEVLVNLYSVSGQLYKRFKCNIEYDKQTKSFNISRFPTGVYFVQFQHKDKPFETKKITITR